MAAASSAYCSGGMYIPALPYRRMRSRTRPPISSLTGKPFALPRMSSSAISTEQYILADVFVVARRSSGKAPEAHRDHRASGR